ncbi:MAG TPA: VanZ family protein [Bryobacteraceae bacterium]
MCSNRARAVTKLAAILLALAWLLCGTSCKRAGKQAAARATTSRAARSSRSSRQPKIYPHSVVPGGIHTVEEFAAKPDALARQHYRGLRPTGMVRNPREGLWYVSFRTGDSIYWTRRRLRIPQGEALLKLAGRSGISFARTRCGNLLSDVPQRPVLPAKREKAVENELSVESTDEEREASLNAALLPPPSAISSLLSVELAPPPTQSALPNAFAVNQTTPQTGSSPGSGGSGGAFFFPDNSLSGTTPGSGAPAGSASRSSASASSVSDHVVHTVTVTPEPASWSLIVCAGGVITLLAGASRRLRLKGRCNVPWPHFCFPAGYLMPRISAWAWIAAAWVGIIFFSSTSLASKWAEAFFNSFSSEFLQSLRNNSSSLGIIHLFADKGFHVMLFCVLALLLWLALGNMNNKGWIILASGFTIGSISEFLQSFFPDRDPALRDVVINTTGTALGIVLCLLADRVRIRRHTVLQPETHVTSNSPR